MEKYFIVYKTVNKVNGKFYIGSHQTFDLGDGYLGSGVLLKKALRKYGRKCFNRETIARCSSVETMRDIERQLVNYHLTNSPKQCYNLAQGGTGAMLGEKNAFYGKKHSEETRKHLSTIKMGKNIGNLNPFFGKKHSEQTILKIKKTKKLKGVTTQDISGFIKRSKGWFCTPEGCFYSKREAAKYSGISAATVYTRCMGADKMVVKNYQTPNHFWGKTWREVGYYFYKRADRE